MSDSSRKLYWDMSSVAKKWSRFQQDFLTTFLHSWDAEKFGIFKHQILSCSDFSFFLRSFHFHHYLAQNSLCSLGCHNVITTSIIISQSSLKSWIFLPTYRCWALNHPFIPSRLKMWKWNILFGWRSLLLICCHHEPFKLLHTLVFTAFLFNGFQHFCFQALVDSRC